MVGRTRAGVASEPAAEKVLYLFCDANLFLQCKPPQDLDWSGWSDYAVIRLIVSDPVLREIDALKNKGNDRQSRRARAASAAFRKMLPSGTKDVRASDPTVTLHVEPQHRRDEELRDQLDYGERDDQLIGTAYEFGRSHADVRLLTHDTTALFLAGSVGLDADAIPNEWLLPPEPDGRDRQISSLKEQLGRLMQDRPAFAVQFEDGAGKEAKRYHATFDLFTPIPPDEVARLIDRLKERFPIATDFGPLDSAEQPSDRAVFFVPATEKEIADYRDDAYPAWLACCEQFLSAFHKRLQARETAPEFTFLVENQGMRPAKDCLVTIESEGPLLLMPPRSDYDDEDSQEGEPDALAERHTLPGPPSPPRGHWRFADVVRGIVEPIVEFQNFPDIDDLLTPVHAPPRDPNSLYYKGGLPEAPAAEFTLECQQWRHADGWLPLAGELHFPSEPEDAKGAVVIRLQAENLPVPHEKRIPVRVDVRHRSVLEHARELVELLPPG